MGDTYPIGAGEPPTVKWSYERAERAVRSVLLYAVSSR